MSDCVVILRYGKNLDKFRVKFVEKSERLVCSENGIMDLPEKYQIISTEFSEAFIPCKDFEHAMIVSHMVIDDLGSKVTGGIHEVFLREEL